MNIRKKYQNAEENDGLNIKIKGTFCFKHIPFRKNYKRNIPKPPKNRINHPSRKNKLEKWHKMEITTKKTIFAVNNRLRSSDFKENKKGGEIGYFYHTIYCFFWTFTLVFLQKNSRFSVKTLPFFYVLLLDEGVLIVLHVLILE